ncbi:MAG TPA: putative ABC exporter domain-containing protein [Candidatus Didemnitutus sp.]|nr:putative ABC exporter domain-containing protein [Candidatus Didemnitutus sp.]
MTRAFFYLYATSVRNALAQRFKRLRQPKYLFGALVGGAYFYFFFFRKVFGGFRGGATAPAPAEVTPLYVSLAALILLTIVVLSWILPNSRAALQFTEAEAAFLFPAPVSRRMLIHFKLLRSQLGILVSAFFLTLIFRRSSALGGSALTHAVGWWLILSTLNLHFLGASFARERMLDFGLSPWRRRVLVSAAALAVAAGCWFIVRQTVPAPTEADVVSYATVVHYANEVLSHPPISWVLAPAKFVIAPYLAVNWPAFVVALGPALLLLVAHYFWVARSNVSFEEASLELAARRAERLAAIRSGRWTTDRDRNRKPKPEPFRLKPRGWTAIAFLWKNLIALGPFFRFRVWLIACVVVVAAVSWIGADPGRAPMLKIAGAVASMIAVWTLFIGPMLMRREVQQTLSHMDITKAYPMAGWQVVLGQLLTPMLLLTFVEWLLLLVSVLCLGDAVRNPMLAAALGAGGAFGLALVVPPLVGLMLCIPYAGVLYFPAWAQATGTHGGGVEVMGQRLIFVAGYLLVLLVAVLPAAGAGFVVMLIANWLGGPIAATIGTAVTVSAVLVAELSGAVYWLGEKFSRFDLSTEMPR